MKLSQMSAEQLLTALCRLTGPVCTLLEDENVQQMMAHMQQAGTLRTTPDKAWEMLLRNVLPLLLNEHREETIAIAAALLDQPLEAVRAGNGAWLLRELIASWEEELIRFFPCAAGTVSHRC